VAARHRSRRRALQVLFEWDMRGDSIDSAIQNYYETLYSDDGENTEPLKPDRFMEQLARGTAADVSEIDKQIAAKSEHWRVERMAVVDRNILRLAIYELRLAELPAPVVIDEALELARQFSSDESLAFINGVLDAVHRQANAAGGR
jgi:transcription antitermination protein NusB